MKRCEYCGKRYGDDVTVCPVDGQPVTSPEAIPRPDVSRQGGHGSAFNASLIVPFSRSGKYRIYVRSSDLIFIRIEGNSSILVSAHGLLGPFGAVIPFILWLSSRHKAGEFNRRLEEADPEDLFRTSEKNFRLHLSEIREAVFESSSFWGRSGNLNLSIRQGEKMKLAFASSDDFKTAQELLTPLLPSALRASAKRNESVASIDRRRS